MQFDYQDIKKAVIRSQHCQRNWDLSREIPDEDIKLLTYAVKNCPSKQNVAFYNVHFITNRDIIEKIHANTSGFKIDNEYVTNSQTLANLLVVFSESDKAAGWCTKFYTGDSEKSLSRDQHMAVGIAAGYINLTSSILGYSTGCCACFDNKAITDILNINSGILLLMGVGFKDENRNRRIHQKDENLMFPTFSKEDIKVTVIK